MASSGHHSAAHLEPGTFSGPAMSKPFAPRKARRMVVAMVGPTAVGKTSLALALADQFNAEIVSADSRQVYRYMDIGTAKPKLADRLRVPHHLIDILDPDEDYNAHRFQQDAWAAIGAVLARDRLPLLVGGTGLYVNAALGRYHLPVVGADPALRARLEKQAEDVGADALHTRLKDVDPVSAEGIDARNVRRVIRALEVYELTGQPFSEFHKRAHPVLPWRSLVIGLNREREKLYARINQRALQMVQEGLLEETRWLLAHGFGPHLNSMRSVGYSEMCKYLAGELGWADAVNLFQQNSRRLAKRQMTWFRAQSDVVWLDASQPDLPRRAADLIADAMR